MYFCRIYLDIWLNGGNLQRFCIFDQLENLLRFVKVDLITFIYAFIISSDFPSWADNPESWQSGR